jgi:hypothetical protein
MTTWPAAEFMVCVPLPDDGTRDECTSGDETDASSLLYSVFGADVWGDFAATMVCGTVESRTDACCYVLDNFEFYEIIEGRPFTVNGEARLAPCGPDNGWAQTTEWTATGLAEELRGQLIEHWTQSARFEHASVASFARFTMQLMAIGAPASLVTEATRAQGDEIRHTRICLGIASSLANETIGLAAIPVDGALDLAGDVSAILVDTIREACVNETIAAAQCQAAGQAATDPMIRAALNEIAEDEQRHATLAWKTVRWILDEHPELRTLAQKTFDEALNTPWGSPNAQDASLTHWGVASQATEAAIAQRVLRRVVRPCADALFDTSTAVAATA